MFKKSIDVSCVLCFVISITILVKDFFLGGEKVNTLNNLLLLLLILFTLSMIITTIFLILNWHSHIVKSYKTIFFSLLFVLPLMYLIIGYYITSPLPTLLSNK